MLIEFSGEHSGTVLMFGKAATELLKMMGQSSNNEGAISAADVPTALNKLKEALASIPDTENESDDDYDKQDKEVSLQTRAVPLIELLEENVAGNGYVMWKPQK